MKNFTLASAILLVICTISCRESDEVLAPQDLSNIQKIEDIRNQREAQTTPNATLNNTNSTTPSFDDGEIQSPPRK